MNVEDMLVANSAWADRIEARDPDFFPRLAQGQAPPVLWIGCADSRVPPDRVVGADPGSLFVHRNVANVVNPSDLNMMSVLQYATDALKVQRIVVCGHQCCGGVGAVVDGLQGGILGHWLAPIAEVARRNRAELLDLPDRDARIQRLVELNVQDQVARLSHTAQVQGAWERGQSLEIHGLVFHLATGRLQDLDCSIHGPTG